MTRTFRGKLVDEIKAFVIAPIYPFMQKYWFLNMWLFALFSYLPIVNVIIARGWRKDYIHRIAWRNESVLPNPKDLLKFLRDGVKLWLVHGLYLLLPVVLIMAFGLGGLVDLFGDIKYIVLLSWDYFVRRTIETPVYLNSLWVFTKTEFIHTAIAFLLENIYLVIYVPLYRIAMIRYSVTGKLRASHLAVVPNLKFLFRNFVGIILMYAFNVFNFLIILAFDFILELTVVGIPLIPIVTVYMFFWNSGYEYGLLGRSMVEDECLAGDAVTGLTANTIGMPSSTDPAVDV